MGTEEACFRCIDEDDVIVYQEGCGGPGYASAPVCDQPECSSNPATSGNFSTPSKAKSFLSESGFGFQVNTNETTGDYSVRMGFGNGDAGGLGYSSFRDPGKAANYTIKYRFLDMTPMFIGGYTVKFQIAGNIITQNYNANEHEVNWVWDGLDNLGNPAPLPQVLTASISMGGETVQQEFILGSPRPGDSGTGGWAPEGMTVYSPQVGRVFLANGRTAQVEGISLPGGETGVVLGEEVKVFDTHNKHIRTVNALTGEILQTITYNIYNQVTKVTDSYGNETTYHRNGSGDLIGIENADGLTAQINMASGKITSVVSPEGDTFSMTYDSTTGMLKSLTEPSGKTTTYHHDALGNLKEVSFTGGSGFEYNFEGYDTIQDAKVTTKVSAEGREETIGVNKSLDHTSTLVIDSIGVNRTYEDYFGVEGSTKYTEGDTSTEIEFEEDVRFGEYKKAVKRITQKQEDLLKVSNYTHSSSLTNPADPFSIVTLSQTVNTNSKVSSSVYTAATQTWLHTSPEGRTQAQIIDDYEKPVSEQIGSLTPTVYDYDLRGRVEKVTQGARESELTYNSEGFVSQVENALGQVTSYTYDDDGKVETATLPDLRVVEYKYDSNENLLEITPAGKPKHNFIYNTFAMIQQYLPPVLGGTPRPVNYVYNDDEELTSIERSDGTVVSYNRGSTRAVLDSISVGSTTLYQYDYNTTNGMISEAASMYEVGNGLTYKGNLLESDTWVSMTTMAQLGKLSNTYNNDFWLTSQSVQGTTISTPDVLNFTYDDDGLITNVGSASYTYRSMDPLLAEMNLGLLKEEYAYNTFGELTSKETTYNSSAVFDIDYTRDALGRVATKTEDDGTSTHTYEYVYDVSGRLEEVKKDSVTVSTYVYDDNNNRTGGNVSGTPITATYDNQDRLLTYNDLTFTYNHNGERTGRTDTTTSQTTSYDYNALGQLEKITLPSTDEIEYAYDGLGRRVARSYNGTPTDLYVYENDLRIVADLNPSTGEVKSRYVYVSQSHSPDFMIRGGESYQFVKDHLGSVKLVVKVSDGAILQNITYDEFGKTLTDSNPGFQPFGFAGGIYDHQASLTKFGVRDYDAEVGRWLTKDPILFNGGDANLYGYVLMDPVNLVDPEGTIVPLVALGGFAGAGFFGGFIGTLINDGTISEALIAGGCGALGASAGAIMGTSALGVIAGGLVGNAVGGMLTTGQILGSSGR